MSLFKEKDDLISDYFKEQFNGDSSSDDEELADEESAKRESQQRPEESLVGEDGHLVKKFKDEDRTRQQTGDEEQSLPINHQEGDESTLITLDDASDSIECIDIDLDSDDDPNIKLSHKKPSRRKCHTKPTDGSCRFITISDDDDDDGGAAQQSDTSRSTTDLASPIIQLPQPPDANSSNYLDDDDDFNLKITLFGAYKQFRTTYKTKLKEALKDLINDIESHGKSLILTESQNNRQVSLDESPYSLNLGPGTILTAIEVAASKESESKQAVNQDEITVKLQDGNRKHTKEFKIIKHEPMLKLKELYAREFGLEDITHIKLIMDGDNLEDDSTAEEHDIDDGFVIDVVVS